MKKTKLGNWLKTKLSRENKATMENIYEALLQINNTKDATIVMLEQQIKQKDEYTFDLMLRIGKIEAEKGLLEKQYDKALNYLEKIATIVKDLGLNNKDLAKEVKELKSDRYKVVKIRESKGRKTEGAKQELKARTPKASVTSKVIKKVKNNE